MHLTTPRPRKATTGQHRLLGLGRAALLRRAKVLTATPYGVHRVPVSKVKGSRRPQPRTQLAHDGVVLA
jgi:hypothetical protein